MLQHRQSCRFCSIFWVVLIDVLPLSGTSSLGDAWAIEGGREVEPLQGFSPCNALVTVEVPGDACLHDDRCTTVSVRLDDPDLLSIKKIRVTFALSHGILLCDMRDPAISVHPGAWAASDRVGIQVFDEGNGAYTVQEVLLGTGRGMPGGGELFTIDLRGLAGDYLGAVSLMSVNLWPQPGGPCAARLGPPGVVHVDTTPPDPISDLAAIQLKAGNDRDGTTKIIITFSQPSPPNAVEVYRVGFGNYPEYDDPPEAGASPVVPAYPPGPPWILVPVTESGRADEPSTRDFWYYVAFVTDKCGNASAASNMTEGTLNYHLGDVFDGGTPCSGDNLVDLRDMTFFSVNYGRTLAPGDPAACLDIGPTSGGFDGRPLTDDVIDFKDLVVITANLDNVSRPQPLPNLASSQVEIRVDAPSHVEAGERFNALLWLRGSGRVQAASARLDWDPAITHPIGISAGELLMREKGVVLSPRAGTIDLALLGRREIGLSGAGVVALASFRALAAGEPRIALSNTDLRDRDGLALSTPVDASRSDTSARATRLLPPTPNPFRGRTTVSLHLAEGGPLDLGVYSVDGRRLRTLLAGHGNAGVRTCEWDGCDASGSSLASGVYYLRLEAGHSTDSQRLILLR